jgi:hypothetical protein
MKVCVKMGIFFHRLWKDEHTMRTPLYELFEKAPQRSNDRSPPSDQPVSEEGAADMPLVLVADDSVPARLEEQLLAEYLYFRYGRHARQEGSTTHASPAAPFDALPDARKRTLLLLARDVRALLTRARHEGFVQGQEQAACEALLQEK